MRWFVALIFLLLAGCSSSPSPVLPPLDLSAFTPSARVQTLWRESVGEGVGYNYLKLGPVFANNTGYIADYHGLVRAFAADNGKTRWQTKLNVPIAAGPTVDNGRLLFGTNQGQLLALDQNDGHELWRVQLSSEVLAPAQRAGDIIVVRTVDGRLYGLEAANGKRRWVYDRSVPLLTLRGISAPVIFNDIVLLGSDSGKLTALTLNDGIVLWETQIAVPMGRTELERIVDIDIKPVVIEDLVYAATYQGRLAAVQLDNGRIQWVQDLSAYAGMTVDAYRIYITDAQSQLLALNRFNGAILWRQDKMLRRSLTGPVLHGDYVAVADYEGYIHWLARDDGHLVARERLNADAYLFEDTDNEDYKGLFPKAENILATPIVHGDKLVVVDRWGVMSAFKLAADEHASK